MNTDRGSPYRKGVAPRNTGRRVPAIVHDWFVVEGGAESVLVELARLLPTAEIHTSFHKPGLFGGAIDPGRVRTWPPQRLFPGTRRFRSFLPLYPIWFSLLRLPNRPVVISSSIAFTHAVQTPGGGPHISYVYTPLRYAWDLDTYLSQASWSLPARLGARVLRPLLRRWDVATSRRPDVVVAISAEVRDRIRTLWGRDAEVIYPPVNVGAMTVSTVDDGYLLVAARLLSYRRIDLAIEAANRLGLALVVVGDGPELARLQALAGATVEFRGWLERAQLVDLFERCHAYVVPGIEDFGIAPVEAMAAGKPVIGVGRGGVAETVIDGVTGVLFEVQTADSLVSAIERLDTMTVDPAACRARAEEFDTAVFRARWRELFARLGVDPSLYSPP
jgi:glycosyltransferase involved in cell wall biosynthesis